MDLKTTPLQSDEPAAQQKRVLVADDDPHVRQLLEMVLSEEGYEVLAAGNGHELVRLAQEHTPGLILVDLVMPQMDGFEAIRQIRHDSRTAHIPVLILTAQSRTGDVVVGFETGADDYIAKPFNITELLARVKSHLRRAAQRPVLNPLTGLPGGVLLSQELRRRLGQRTPLALLYTDLDNFKAFNDTYGFSRGDRAIQMVANILQNIMAEQGAPDDFIGHIGGDDFAVLTTPDRARALCRAIIKLFDHEIRELYSREDLRRGYFSAVDRHGILRRFDVMTISIGVVTSDRRGFPEEDEFTRVAAEMKHYAKTRDGSSYAIDKRVSSHGAEVERRGVRQRRVLIGSDDSSLRAVLRATFLEDGCLVQEAGDAAELRRQLALIERTAVVIADAKMGDALWEVCAERRADVCTPPILALAQDDDEIARARAAGVTLWLRQPLPLVDIIAAADQLIADAYERSEDAAPAIDHG